MRAEFKKTRSTTVSFNEERGVNVITHYVSEGGFTYEFTIELAIQEFTLVRPEQILHTRDCGDYTVYGSPLIRIDKIGALAIDLDITPT